MPALFSWPPACVTIYIIYSTSICLQAKLSDE